MSTKTNVMTGSAVLAAAPVAISTVRKYYWSLRREFWENRWLYLAPLATGGLALIGSLVSAFRLPHRLQMATSAAEQHNAIVFPYDMTAGLVMVTVMLVAGFYCLETLYGERRDRSILFWKSLPVSDVCTVLAKTTVPALIVLLGTAITAVTNVVILLVNSAVVAGSGMSAAPLWEHASLGMMTWMLLYHMLTVHLLWWAPFYGWLLLVSAWARRVPLLWGVLPPVAAVVLENHVFQTSHLETMLTERFYGGPAAITPPNMLPFDNMTHLTPGAFFASAGLWVGLALTAAFLATAVQLRRRSGPV